MSARSRLPLVTLLLIAANIVAAFSLIIDPELVQELGFRSNHPGILSAFTSLFLHANLVHLLGNMVFLAAVGAAVELATGSVRFIAVYFVGGLCGVLMHALFTRRVIEPAPFVGASGCIASCAAYYSVRYTRLKVPLAPKFAISVATVTGVWIGLQLLGAVLRFGEQGGTSFWAHIGGFLAGAAMSLVFRAPDLQQVKLGHEVLDKMNARGPAASAFAAEAHLQKHPKDLKAMWELADAQSMQGESVAETKALLRIFESGPETDRIEALLRLCKVGGVNEIPALKRLQAADQCLAESPDLARIILTSVVEGPASDAQRPDAILALAGLERAASPARANNLLASLVAEYPLHPATELARKRGWIS